MNMKTMVFCGGMEHQVEDLSVREVYEKLLAAVQP